MEEAVAVEVPPSLSRMLATLGVGVLGMVGGLFLIFGPGPVLLSVAAGLAVLATIGFICAIVRQRPRVSVTSQGFTVYKLFGEEPHLWQDVDGPFAVIKIGFVQAVGYNYTAEYRTRTGKKPTTLFSGYDNAISGAFALSAEKLAELLNMHRLTVTGSDAVAADKTRTPAHTLIAPEAHAGGNGSPMIRIAAGVVAVLFAGSLASMIAQEQIQWDAAVLMCVLTLMFSWYAVRGQNGMPQFLAKR